MRSLIPKIESINLWLNEAKFDIITFNETWLTPNIPTSLLDFENYTIIRQDRMSGKKGGGLLTLLSKTRNILCNEAKYTHLNSSTPNIEFQVIELKIGFVKKMILINCYRPPSGKVTEGLNELENALDQISNLKEFEVYINGDLNIPYNLIDSPDYKKLKQFETKYGLTQLIRTPTRCTSKTHNILDLMMTTSNCILDSGSEDLNISDHQPVWLIRKKIPVKIPSVSFECRSFSTYNREQFQSDLNSHD